MNKAELIEALRQEKGLTKIEADGAVNLFFKEMTEALAAGDRVEIRGLCSFFVKAYGSYIPDRPIRADLGPFYRCHILTTKWKEYGAPQRRGG